MLETLRLELVEPRTTAVIGATTTWEEYPRLWPALLDEVWQAVRSSGAIEAGRNVMLYLDQRPRVEVGVEAARPFTPIGSVTYSTLPGGRVLTATHRGPYEELGASHNALHEACDRMGLERLGPLWEIYGHWDEQAPTPVVDIAYLVR